MGEPVTFAERLVLERFGRMADVGGDYADEWVGRHRLACGCAVLCAPPGPVIFVRELCPAAERIADFAASATMRYGANGLTHRQVARRWTAYHRHVTPWMHATHAAETLVPNEPREVVVEHGPGGTIMLDRPIRVF